MSAFRAVRSVSGMKEDLPVRDRDRLASPDAERSQQAYARLAGLMFLVVLALYLTGLFLASAVAGTGSFEDRAERIIAGEPLYRLALVLSLGGTLATMLLAMGLYVAVRPVDRNLALVALLFRTAEAVIGAVGVALSFALLQTQLAVQDAGAFDADQLEGLGALFTAVASGEISAIFFSVGSTLFFWLFLRSGYIPRILAAFGLAASLAYAALWLLQLILPESSWLIAYVSVPALIAEVGTGLWLLIRGIKTERS
jgi:Domain of unknown function (DUF4386)